MPIAISNLRYANPTGSLIDMDVSVDGGEAVPFTLSPTDPAPVAVAVRALLDGGAYEIAAYVPPPPVQVPVPDISDRQFFQQLAIDGVISEEDALAAVQTGFIPAPLQVIVDAIESPAEKFATKMLISGATVFQRSHPMSEAIRVARGMTPADCDAFFRAAAAL